MDRIDYEKMAGEVWKPVYGYEGRYEVSNKGRVRRLYHTAPTRMMKLYRTPAGYLKVQLARRGIYTHCWVHRLVLETFVGPRPSGCITCHNDGDKQNNQVENLRWDTHASNGRDKVLLGEASRGESHWNSRLNNDDVRRIHRMSKSGVLQKDIAEQIGVSESTISHVIHGRYWGHVNTLTESEAANG